MVYLALIALSYLSFNVGVKKGPNTKDLSFLGGGLLKEK